MRAGLAQRARIVLLAADGVSNVEIARLVGVSLPTVSLWRQRYAVGGLAALADQPRSGRPRRLDHRAIVAGRRSSRRRRSWVSRTGRHGEVVPGLVELEVAVPRSAPALR